MNQISNDRPLEGVNRDTRYWVIFGFYIRYWPWTFDIRQLKYRYIQPTAQSSIDIVQLDTLIFDIGDFDTLIFDIPGALYWYPTCMTYSLFRNPLIFWDGIYMRTKAGKTWQKGCSHAHDVAYELIGKRKAELVTITTH